MAEWDAAAARIFLDAGDNATEENDWEHFNIPWVYHAKAHLRHALDALATAEQRAETAERELAALLRDDIAIFSAKRYDQLKDAEAERDTLRARLAEAEAVVQLVLGDHVPLDTFTEDRKVWNEPGACFYCNADILDWTEHPPVADCPWVLARAYVTAHPPLGAAGSGATGEATVVGNTSE